MYFNTTPFGKPLEYMYFNPRKIVLESQRRRLDYGSVAALTVNDRRDPLERKTLDHPLQ